jgi:hypothetical protein
MGAIPSLRPDQFTCRMAAKSIEPTLLILDANNSSG